MRKVYVALVAICILGSGSFLISQDNMKMSQGKFNSFRRAKRIYFKGHVDFTKGNYKKSVKSFRKCVEVFPEFSEAYFYMSKVDYMSKSFSSALGNIKNAQKYHQFMFQLQMSGQTEYLRKIDAVKQVEKGNSVKSNKKNLQEGVAIPSDYYFHEGNIYMRMGKTEKAHEAYVNAVKSNPENKFAYTNLLALLLRGKNGSEAMGYLKKAELNGVIIDPRLKAAVMKLQKK